MTQSKHTIFTYILLITLSLSSYKLKAVSSNKLFSDRFYKVLAQIIDEDNIFAKLDNEILAYTEKLISYNEKHASQKKTNVKNSLYSEQELLNYLKESISCKKNKKALLLLSDFQRLITLNMVKSTTKDHTFCQQPWSLFFNENLPKKYLTEKKVVKKIKDTGKSEISKKLCYEIYYLLLEVIKYNKLDKQYYETK